eukprot:CAMPEP_0174271042 /NCGR_PEP_ID=MMETSP0439-20130205/46572_1 /TAXON_ID=0 /ORGANISM="Stereomyxa ramosa, Strain Chinc5" /LENGTH=280 /DNA_ID=CAMNT_0015360779 /DNA_START=576 /DNA_END=1415 /DNA_ORIENTATION=-
MTLALFSIHPLELKAKFEVNDSMFGVFKEALIFSGLLVLNYTNGEVFCYELEELLHLNDLYINFPISTECDISSVCASVPTLKPQCLFKTKSIHHYIDFCWPARNFIKRPNKHSFAICNLLSNKQIKYGELNYEEDDILAGNVECYTYDNYHNIIFRNPHSISVYKICPQGPRIGEFDKYADQFFNEDLQLTKQFEIKVDQDKTKEYITNSGRRVRKPTSPFTIHTTDYNSELEILVVGMKGKAKLFDNNTGRKIKTVKLQQWFEETPNVLVLNRNYLIH